MDNPENVGFSEIPQTPQNDGNGGNDRSVKKDGKIFYGPVLCMALVLVASLSILGGVATACRTAEPARFRADDATITADVKAKLVTDGDTNPFHIDVTTNHSVVTLEGRVKTEEARQKAERIARQSDGVRRVINLVKVGDRQ